MGPTPSPAPEEAAPGMLGPQAGTAAGARETLSEGQAPSLGGAGGLYDST